VEVLLDGAHNPDGAAALARALDDLRPFLAGGRDDPPAPLTLVFAIMADKDVTGVLRALAGPPLEGALVICTELDLPRALPAAELAAAWQAVHPAIRAIVEPIPEAALDHALAIAPGPVVVAGSLYLVGRARAQLEPDSRLLDPPAVSPDRRGAPPAAAARCVAR
jgi:dihydrofolate synthase/folylpolyglutamate synthase